MMHGRTDKNKEKCKQGNTNKMEEGRNIKECKEDKKGSLRDSTKWWQKRREN
jgi:hypothetical protein